MGHVAIMKKEWGLIPKILSSEKKLESRWYINRCCPWDKITAKDMVYFKNGGEPVTVKAEVLKVLQFDNLDSDKVKESLWRYAADDGLGIEPDKLDQFYERFCHKKYAMFIYLMNPKAIAPFNIDKRGFGAMSAWVSVENINMIIKK